MNPSDLLVGAVTPVPCDRGMGGGSRSGGKDSGRDTVETPWLGVGLEKAAQHSSRNNRPPGGGERWGSRTLAGSPFPKVDSTAPRWPAGIPFGLHVIHLLDRSRLCCFQHSGLGRSGLTGGVLRRGADLKARDLRSDTPAPLQPHVCTQNCASLHHPPFSISLRPCSPGFIHNHTYLGTHRFTLALFHKHLPSVCMSTQRQQA